MPIFDITLRIKTEQMTCGGCSKTIKERLEAACKEKQYTALSVHTDHVAKTAEIQLDAKDEKQASSITGNLIEALGEVGYECVSHTLARLEAPSSSFAPR
jgi:copper chaperone CopZ